MTSNSQFRCTNLQNTAPFYTVPEESEGPAFQGVDMSCLKREITSTSPDRGVASHKGRYDRLKRNRETLAIRTWHRLMH